MTKDRKTLAAIVGVFLFALVLRIAGIGWGLPNERQYYSLHPDEDLILGYSQSIEPAKLDFTPGFYNYGTFYLTLLRVTTDIVGAYGGGPDAETESAFAAAKGSAMLGGRVLSALAGAGTAIVVLLILLPLVGRFGATAGALVVCVAPGHVVHSRFQTVDVVATFFLALSLYFVLRLVQEGITDKAYLKLSALAGLFAGLSAGTKYTGILALTALLAIAVMQRTPRSWKGLGIGILVALVAFLLTTPGALADSGRFLQDFKYEMTHTQQGHGLVFAGTPSGFLFHIWNLVIAIGALVLLLGSFGLFRATFRKHAWAIALLAFAFAYYILIGRAEVKFMRYVFPLLPVVAVGFGWIAGRALSHPRATVQAAIVAFAVFGLASSLAVSSRFTLWMLQPDERAIVAQQLKEESSDSTTVGLASDPWFYTPVFYPQSAAGPYVPFEKRLEWMNAATQPRIVRYVPTNPQERFDFDVRLFSEYKPDYVVVSSFEIGDLNRLKKLPSPPSEYATLLGRAEEFMDILSTDYQRWKVRGKQDSALPHDLAYIRPEIIVWKRKTDSSTPSTGSSTTFGPNEEPAPIP